MLAVAVGPVLFPWLCSLAGPLAYLYVQTATCRLLPATPLPKTPQALALLVCGGSNAHEAAAALAQCTHDGSSLHLFVYAGDKSVDDAAGVIVPPGVAVVLH